MHKGLKIFLIILAIVLILAISGSFIYYYGFFKPNMQREEQEKQEEEQRKKEIEKYIDDYNALQSRYLPKMELNNYDEYMSLTRNFITEIKSLYVPIPCERLHDLQLQYWESHYGALFVFKDDTKKAEEFIEKMLELEKQIDEEKRNLLR